MNYVCGKVTSIDLETFSAQLIQLQGEEPVSFSFKGVPNDLDCLMVNQTLRAYDSNGLLVSDF